MKTYNLFREQVLENKTTCEQEVSNVLERIEDKKDLNAFLETNKNVLEQAVESDKRFKAGNPRRLEGMLVAVKDNIAVKGMKLTAASHMLDNFLSITDAALIEKIKQEGGIIIGKTNMDEFAMGSSNETSYFGAVKNPINTDYVPGGSSGGSAVAVAAELAHTALGTDTGGSIRQPAALCGTVGFKPTYGRISRSGVIAFASSLDQVGTFSHNIEDTSLLFDVISGRDDADQTTADLEPADTYKNLKDVNFENVRVGVLDDKILSQCSCSTDILNVYNKILIELKDKGAVVETIKFLDSEYWVPTYIVLTTVEASANLARYDGIRYGHHTDKVIDGEDYVALNRGEGFGAEVQRRLLAGTYFLVSDADNKYYTKAQQIRQIVKDCYIEAFKKVDFMFLPTTASTAFKFNEKQEDQVKMYLSDLFTTSANLAGIPAISIPAGCDSNGLPIGMQLQTGSFQEEKLFNFAKALLK